MIGISASDTGSSRMSAHLQLGGVTIYGRTEDQILSTIDQIAQTIDQRGKDHLSITRPVLQKLVSDSIGEKFEKRLFGAILGSRIRLGQFHALFCEAEKGAEFRIFIHRNQLRRF